MNHLLDGSHGIGDYVWRHRKFSAAYEHALSLASFTQEGSMILIVGPSGTGKTTLLNQLRRSLAGPVDGWPAGTIPVVAAPICNDVQGLFSSKNFVLRLLGAVEHPFFGVRNSPALQRPSADQYGVSLDSLRLRYSEPHLRLALEKAIEFRGTKFLLLDEAQHLLKTATTRKAVDNLDAIKGFAENTGTKVFLFGTFEILPIWNRSAQLNRRLHDVILHRYFVDRSDDVEEFARILESFSQVLPLARGFSLRDGAEFVYCSTLGIIGEVVRLLVGALGHMRASGETEISERLLRLAAHSPAKLETLRRETIGGESMLLGEMVPDRFSKVKIAPAGRKGRRGRRRATRDPAPSRPMPSAADQDESP